MTTERRAKYWIALQLIFGQGSSYINKITDAFGTALDFFRAGEAGWKTIDDILPLHLEQLARPDIDAVDKIIADCYEVGCRIVTPEDEEYPEALRHIYGMPAVLYVLGDLSCLKDHLAIAMVGTRECSSVGISVADKLARELARQKVVVVSGLARGIDSACHWGAICGGSKTVAFLSCGLDQVYPPENASLADSIRANGAVVSEYPPGTSIKRHSFHIRNRLISGVSRGVVMVEGASNSGTNITITHGLEQGKEIFVVPWNIDTPSGTWAVKLLREGAIPVCCGAQILEEYGYYETSRQQESETEREERHGKLRSTLAKEKRAQEKAARAEREPEKKVDLPKEETAPAPRVELALEGDLKRVYDALAQDAMTMETLAENVELEADEVAMLLTELELLGAVSADDNKVYHRL